MSIYEQITGEKPKKKKKQTYYDQIINSQPTTTKTNLVEEDIAPVKTTNFVETSNKSNNILDTLSTIKKSISVSDRAAAKGREIRENNPGGKFFKSTKETENIKNTLADGYQFGDSFKTNLSTAKIILNTTGDLAANVGKGFMNTIEGVVDTARIGYGDLIQKSANKQADVLEFLGQNELAENRRKAGQTRKEQEYKKAKLDVTGALLGETNDIFKNNWSQKLNEQSVAGSITNSVEQGVGNIGAFIGLSQLTGGSTASTFLNSFTSAYGNTLTGGLRSGLDEKEAKGKAVSSGLAEAISEQFFQGIPGLKSAGWADDLISKPVEKYLKGKTGKIALKVFDSLGEGLEEGISNFLEATFEGIRKGDSAKQIFNDATGTITSEETREAFISALISSALTNGGSSLITNAQKNSIIKSYANEHNMSVEQTKQLFDSIVEKKVNTEDTENYKEKVDLEEGISRGLAKEIKDNKIDLEELYKTTPGSKQEMQFNFNEKEAKNVKTERQKTLANDMARLNNTEEVHKLYDTVNAIQKANDTQQYHITTTEGLYEMGIVNKNENGEYTMPDGSPYVPRGLNYKNGEIYINADVGSKSGTQAMYHEMFEGFKKSSPEQYNEFKQMVKDIVGEDTINNEIAEYTKMYGEQADVEDEIINDKFGELAENQNFINKIADNRNVLEKFIDSIKNMIKYVKGTDEEKQLIKLQKNLEKEFAKRYKETDFSKGEGDTAYSLTTNKDSNGRELSKGQQEFFKDSKVVDENGNLMEVYHGGEKQYNVFRSEFNEYYFTNDKNAAQDYGSLVRPFYLNFTNPYIVDFEGANDKANSKYENGVFDVIDYAKENGYDSAIIKNTYDGANTHDQYVAFNQNQIKNIDNLNPTDNEDIRKSLTSNQNLESKEIAPIRQDIDKLSEKIDNLSKQLETLENEPETKQEIAPVKGYVEEYKKQPGEDKNSVPLNEESAETYANALSNDEGYIKSLEESAENYIEPNGIEQSNAVKLSNKAGDLLGLSTEQIMNLRERIKEYAQKDYTVDEIREDLEKNFASRTYTETSDALNEAKRIIRQTPLNVSQAIKNDIADYGDFKKKHFGKMTFSKSGLPVDVAYKKLMESSLKGVLDQDIVNPTDELLELARIVDDSNKTEVQIVATPQELDNAADFIQQSILNAKYEEQEASLNSLDRSLEDYEEIAPTTIRTQESIDNTIENRDIAPIRQQEVDKGNPKNQNKVQKAWQTIQETMINRNYVIDKLAQTTGNQDVKYKGDAWNNVSSEAQYNINNYQTDNNYNRVGKSIKDIFEPSKKAGLYEAFNDYLIQKSNIERTDAGKGSAIPYEVSVQLVNMYEQENPQFKTWAKDVYKYFDNVLQDQVDSGLISQEEYDYFRGETGIYRSYVPFYPGEFVASRYFDNEGNLKTPTTLKRSKGGAHDILAVEDSMAKQTYAYKNAIRQNDLFNEIVSTLGANDNGLAAELRGNPTDLDMSLFVDPETNDKYVTAYVEGDRYSAKISDELYNELGRVKENQVKEFEDNLSGILNPVQKVSNVRRNLLTAWNPVFLVRNGIKDIQDAMINSKQTGEMLKAYFGVGQKAAILELSQAKTKEAQQFLAAYGTEGTYGDYSGDTKSKIINKISNANELIELAPRFAEFKATLKNGGSVQQALYNAREVTTNFGRGGYLAKAMNRNGFTFLNANIQGLDKIVRNLSGENGAKGVVTVVAKGALFGIAPSILNELLFGSGDDKDKEYEALPDYVKDNYYLIKLSNGKFLRIPKGRILSVIGSAARRTIEAAEGEENAFKGWGENAWSQIGVGDSGGLQTIFTPIRQAIKNEAWYGGDIVPTRLQKLPAEEQYDEKTDAISKKIGEIFKVSPKKVNYIIDQYSGGIGDLLLPTITPATSNGAEGVGYLTAPLSDAFIVNSTDDNKYASEFYTLKDELQIKSNSSKATDEEQLRYKYINSVSSDLTKLYTERREVQADTTLSKSEKYEKVQKIQDEINALARDGVVQSKDIKVTEDYATVNDVEYYKDDEGKWQKLSDNDILDTAGMTGIEKSTYFHAKEKISVYNKEYKEQTKDLNKSTDTDLINQYAAEKKQNIINAVINSGLSNQDKAILYSNYYSSEETMNNVVNAGYDVDDYITAMNDIDILREEYSAKKGYSTAQRKALTISYVDSLNMNEVQKAMMLRQYYSSFDSYNNEIVNYVSNLNISQEEKIAILKQCKFTVKQKNGEIVISW